MLCGLFKMANSSRQRLVLDRAYYESLLGRIIIYADETGIVKIEHDGQSKPENVKECSIVAESQDDHGGSGSKTNAAILANDNDTIIINNKHIDVCISWLRQYFNDPRKLKDIEEPALSMRLHQSKPFLMKVWQILRQKSKPGESISYGKLAILAGNPKAGRSVGLAMRRNPFPIIVPCHRVIRADAKIGNYSWLNGTETKKWLLDHEKGFSQELLQKS